MDGIVTKLEDGRLFIKLNTSIYEKEAVMAAAYKMTDSCFIIIKPLDNTLVGIFFESKKFCNEVLDQQVRLDVEKRYGNIRDLLIMQAFRPIENIGDKIKA